jgi:Tol biopolymer transport system component
VKLFQRVEWISNGHALSYIKTANGVSNIWSYNLDDESEQQLTNFETDQIFAYAWSPDNKKLACARGTEINDVMIIGNEH